MNEGPVRYDSKGASKKVPTPAPHKHIPIARDRFLDILLWDSLRIS